MIIHISEERNKRILEEGYKIEVPDQMGQEHCYQSGDTVFHLLPGERGVCPVCAVVYESVPAETAVDLEIAKVVLATDPDISMESLRQYLVGKRAA